MFAPPVTRAAEQAIYIAQEGVTHDPSDWWTTSSCKTPDLVGSSGYTIEEAVAASSAGGTIYLCSGTYEVTDTIFVNVTRLTLEGIGDVVLDGDNAEQIIYAANTLTVRNITFVNGYNRYGNGGAIRGTILHIFKSAFYSNSARYNGGAIFASILVNVSQSVFEDNFADAAGAIHSPHITSSFSRFVGNQAQYSGGAMQADQVSSSNNVFAVNAALQGNGGAIDAELFTGQRDTFNANYADEFGGGLSVANGSIVSSSFSQNTALLGGAWYGQNPTPATILKVRSNRFNQNSAFLGGAVALRGSGLSASTLRKMLFANVFKQNVGIEGWNKVYCLNEAGGLSRACPVQ
jgi:predicted outer membrane repeat protein